MKKKSAFSNEVFLASDENERVITGSSYHAYVKLSEGCNQTYSFVQFLHLKENFTQELWIT